MEKSDGIDMATVPRGARGVIGFFRKRKGNFYVVLVVFVLGFLANAIAGDVYERYKPWKESEDDFVQRIIDAQKEEFQSVNENIAQIRGGLSDEGQDALRDLERSIAGLERQSAGLVQQLDLARQEIGTMATIAESRGGLGSGYDFALAENTSMDLAPGAVIGVRSVSDNYIHVNLTSGGDTVETSRSLRSGQSLSFVGAGGSQCHVALMSIRKGNPGVASFKTGCGSPG